jgi:hypothetical protein
MLFDWMQTRCSTGDAAGSFSCSVRAILEASMMAAFYHGERAVGSNAAGSILGQAPGIRQRE